MTKTNFHDLTRTQLFAHNDMQDEIMKVDPFDKLGKSGILGRAKDVLIQNGYAANGISVDGPFDCSGRDVRK